MLIADETDSVESLIAQLQESISNKKSDSNKEEEENLELKISKLIDQCYFSKNFYKLPLETVLSILSRIDFSDVDGNIQVFKEIISNSVESYNKQSILLLTTLRCAECPYTVDECIDILKQFNNSELCYKLCNLYEQEKSLSPNYQIEIDK